jgi:glycerol-3-phosphate dehydrogenase (NAD(P)+)
MRFDHIGVLGAGAWGCALANVIARAGRRLTLWTHDPQAAAAIARTRESPRLPGIRIDDAVAVTAELATAAGADAVLLVVPAQALREVAGRLKPLLRAGAPLVGCAKGIERGTHKFMSEVIADCAPTAVPAILSGPSFAVDVARGLPTAVTLACADDALAQELVPALGSASFRPYRSSDVRGVELGGAAKNVVAIAAGIVSGRKLGASAAAALTTRGFAELFRFGQAFGARPETLVGLSGLGDLILTCSGPQSRNFALGLALGQGQPLDVALGAGKLTEGAFTARVLVELAAERGVEMPIAQAVAAILDGRLGIDAAIESLMTRPFRAEG